MSPVIVTRRFEVRVADATALAGVKEALSTAAAREHLKPPTIRKSSQPAMVTVRLEGTAAATTAVRDSVPGDGIHVYRDWLDVPPTGPGEDHVFPDERARARIDPEGRSREPKPGAPVIIAVVDSGIMLDHPRLSGHRWTDPSDQKVHGARFMNGKRGDDVSDQDGHGTMLAGTILATANFVEGVEIMPLKFFDVVTHPAAPSAAEAIRFATAKGAHIINLSFDLGIGSFELQDAIWSACDAGVLVVMAAGNTGSNNDAYPLIPVHYARTRRDRTIVVMATDWYDERPTFSNFGKTTVDLAAPGVRIASTRSFFPYGAAARQYGRYTGTSAAAAQVTGAAALLKSQGVARTAEEIKVRLMETVDPLPRLKCASGGRLNLSRALG
jgi:subtilase family protein